MSTNTIAELFEKHEHPLRHGRSGPNPIIIDSQDHEVGNSTVVELLNALWEQHQAAQPKDRFYVHKNADGSYDVVDRKHETAALSAFWGKTAEFYATRNAEHRNKAEQAARMNAADTEQQGEAETIMVRGAIRAEQPAEPKLPEWTYSLYPKGTTKRAIQDFMEICCGENALIRDYRKGATDEVWQRTQTAAMHAVACVNAQAGHQRVRDAARDLAEYVDGATTTINWSRSFAEQIARDLLTALNETETTDAK